MAGSGFSRYFANVDVSGRNIKSLAVHATDVVMLVSLGGTLFLSSCSLCCATSAADADVVIYQ